MSGVLEIDTGFSNSNQREELTWIISIQAQRQLAFTVRLRLKQELTEDVVSVVR
jgi:hypothetical protein